MSSGAVFQRFVVGSISIVVLLLAETAPTVAGASAGQAARSARVQDGQQRTLYVATDGSDDGDGSAESPWQSLQRAADVVEPGDTVVIAPGEYLGGITIDSPGTEGRPITFRGADFETFSGT